MPPCSPETSEPPPATTARPACPKPTSASIVFYGDRDFTRRLGSDPEIADGRRSYALVTVDIAQWARAYYCVVPDSIIACASATLPFDPAQPGSTGCNSPGAVSTLLYDRPTAYLSAQYAAQAPLYGPPGECSGSFGFEWLQQMFAQPSAELLVQVNWTATLAPDAPCEDPSGSSAASFHSACPEDTHFWSKSKKRCLHIKPVNVWIWNQVNVSQSQSSVNANSNINNVAGGRGSQPPTSDDRPKAQDDCWCDDDWCTCGSDDGAWWVFGFLLFLLLLLGLCLSLAYCYESDHVEEHHHHHIPPPPPPPHVFVPVPPPPQPETALVYERTTKTTASAAASNDLRHRSTYGGSMNL